MRVVCIIHRDSSRGCCTVRRRGWRSLVSCCTPFFRESMIWSFSNFWYLSIIFLSNTNTATSCRVEDKQLSAELKCCYWMWPTARLEQQTTLSWGGTGLVRWMRPIPVWWTSWCHCRSSSTSLDPHWQYAVQPQTPVSRDFPWRH